MNSNQTRNIVIFAVLAALMAATRMHHFGNALHLPDASLSVFLLTGIFISSPWVFAWLLLEAGALDYVAINFMGISEWCVTPAYFFLIPTYAILWFAGRYYARIHRHSLQSLGAFTGISFVALNLAFAVSNGSFYLFSGRYQDTSVAEYSANMMPFYFPYLSGGLLYLACAVMLYAAFAFRTHIAHAE